jgi:hypothetical protein
VRLEAIDPLNSEQETNEMQERPSILALHTDLAPVSDPAESDKVLAASISSMLWASFLKLGAYVAMFPLFVGVKGSRKLGFSGGYNVPLDANPFHSPMRVLDCGDIPVTSYVWPAGLYLKRW